MKFKIKNKATIFLATALATFFVAQIYAAPGDKTEVGSVSSARHKRLSSATLDYNRMPNKVVVQDSLTSASTTEALSAKQGKNLKDTHDNYSTAQEAVDAAQDANINARLATSTAATTYQTLAKQTAYSTSTQAQINSKYPSAAMSNYSSAGGGRPTSDEVAAGYVSKDVVTVNVMDYIP